MNDFKSVLDAPCVFCGYDGPNYLQKGSHKKSCPFHDIKGHADRQKALRGIIKKLMRKKNENNKKAKESSKKSETRKERN